MKTAQYNNGDKVELVHSTMSDVRLPRESVDTIILISVRAFDAKISPQGLLELDGKAQACLKTMVDAIKPGGKIFYFSGDLPGAPMAEHFESITYPFLKTGMRMVEKSLVRINRRKSPRVVFQKPSGRSAAKDRERP